MRIPKLLVVVILTTAMAVSPGAAAADCDGDTIMIQVGPDKLYIDESGHKGGERHWSIYLETNDEGGLQRGGPGAVSGGTFPFLFIGFCSESTDPDTRLYP